MMFMQFGVKQNEKQLGAVIALVPFSYRLLPLPIGFLDYPCLNRKKYPKVVFISCKSTDKQFLKSKT